MVRINLLPEFKRQESKEQLYIKIYCIFLAIFYIALIVSGIYIKKEKDDIEHKVQKLQQEIKQQNKLMIQLRKLKETEKDIDIRIKAIAKLQKNRSKIVKLIDTTITKFPKNKIYLTRYTAELNNIEMEGFALNLTTIAQYMKKLEESKKFNQITLEKTQRKKIKNYELVNFVLKLTIKNENLKNDTKKS